MVNNEQDALFQENAGRTARLLAYGIIAIFIMVADHRSHYLEKVRGWAHELLIPIYETIDLPFHGWAEARIFLTNQQQLKQHLETFRQENLELRAKALQLDNLRQDNNRLRELLGAIQQRELRVLFTELVRIDLDPYSHRVVIDRGANDGIKAGQAVIDGSGVFGQVQEVAANGAVVILISDPNHALPVKVNRSGLRSLAYGTGNPVELVLPDLPMNSDVNKGDLIVTSGLGGRFPPGLPVAEVVSMSINAKGDFARAMARPLAGLDRSGGLLVILNSPRTGDEP